MRIARPVPLTLLACLAALAFSGCNGMRRVGNGVLPGQPFGKAEKIVCKQSNKDYVGAKEMPPLKAPDGLENPDTRNGLKIPQLNTPERVRGRDEACLDAPPPFGSSKSSPPPPPVMPAKPREVPTQ
jgi:hypothetical protein